MTNAAADVRSGPGAPSAPRRLIVTNERAFCRGSWVVAPSLQASDVDLLISILLCHLIVLMACVCVCVCVCAAACSAMSATSIR